MSTRKVIKNSLWLIIQPLALNIISIFVTAYIARTLGQADYGKFIFTMSFVGIFLPLTNMGLSTITVREISENKSRINEFLGKMLTLRFLLALIAMVIIYFSINMLNYPLITKTMVYIFSLTVVFNSLNSVFTGTFQAYEKMEYVALTQFISGAVLTLLSVIVLYVGYRLVGLIWVYTFGSFLGFIVAIFYTLKKFSTPKIAIDFNFWKENLKKSAPFFYPSLVNSVGLNFSVTFLSKVAGDISTGAYGAADSLISRLSIIPDSICTALFPTMSSVYKNSKEEALKLFQRFFLYLFLLGLPIGIGTTILAGPIINLIYGAKYSNSILVLQILACSLFLGFLDWVMIYTLGAIHREKKTAKVFYVTSFCYLILCFILIPKFKEVGIAIAMLIKNSVSFVMLFKFMRRYLGELFEKELFIKAIIANLVIGIFIYLLKNFSIFIPILSAIISYFICLLVLRVISTSELAYLKQLFLKKINNKTLGSI